MNTTESVSAFRRANAVLVGGVNSPVRAYAAVGGQPVFVASAEGAWITDIDGNRYVDYVASYGPALLGHAHPAVVGEVQSAAAQGLSFGAPTEREIQLAELVLAALPSAEKVRFVNSGTEAVMTAVRLARGATGRTKIIKCIGCYHGHSDPLLVSAGSGATTLGVPSSPGVPVGATADTLLVPFNDLAAVEQAIAETEAPAAVLLEPVAGNMGVIPPAEGYLPGLRDLCDRCGALLIFDEVMTGFRVAHGGAQERYGVRPDLTTLGKVIGGGMPVGAVAGPRDLMKHLAPEGPVYQAGTLSGNPLAMAAGVATLTELRQEGFYESLENVSARLAEGLLAAAREAGLDEAVRINRVGSMMTLFFSREEVTDYAGATASDTDRFARYFQAMLQGGVFLPPSAFEAIFVSASHGDAEIQQTLSAARAAMAELAS